MALPLEPLKGTDNLGEGARCGIQKHWPLKSKAEDSLHWDYIQKVNYAVQDFNDIIAGKAELSREDVVFAITLINWINDAVERVTNCYREEVVGSFAYSQQSELDAMRKYFRAVRSFVNAHPLETDRHGSFGFDGTLVCIDIRNKSRQLDAFGVDFYKVTPSGYTRVNDLSESDVILYAYSKNDGGMFFHHIGMDLNDVRHVASLCIAKLYELDKYLGSLKKRDFQL